jgi:hypothetical protein
MIPPALLFFLGLLWLFKVFCASILTLGLIFQLSEERHWNFDWDCSEHIDCFQLLSHFTILNLPIHEHEISFQLLMSSLIYFFRDL